MYQDMLSVPTSLKGPTEMVESQGDLMVKLFGQMEIHDGPCMQA